MEWLLSLTTEAQVMEEIRKIELRCKKAKTLPTMARVGNIRASLYMRLEEVK